jgi:hypothetical protein
VFVGPRPFSAQFYSQGHAIRVDSVDQCWRRIGTDPAYVAIPSRYSDALIASAAAHEKGTESNKTAAAKPSNIVSRVYRHGNFDLFYVAAH